MIISFEIDNMEDVNLMLQLAKRLGIKQVDNKIIKSTKDSANEINDEINDIFGNDNINLYL